MNKVRNKFVLYAMLSLFALLTVLLAIINGINFTMASADADMITQRLRDDHGTFDNHLPKNEVSETIDLPETDEPPLRTDRRMGPMGPESPDMDSSLRYFTYAFDKLGNPKFIAYHLSAVRQDEARRWAKSLLNEEGTGWTRGTYRYRVYTEGKRRYVTIIDQGRELLPSYRILVISVCGEFAVLLISFAVLMSVGKRLFKPLEEADRKQKSFIKTIESDFKVPLTVVSADVELIERDHGPSDQTRSINRQISRMTALVKDIGSLAIFEENNEEITHVNLSSTLGFLLDHSKDLFKEKGIELEINIEEDIIINGRDELLQNMLGELLENSLKYAKTHASFTLRKESDRILLEQQNDAELSDGSVDRVFDRFTTLENAAADSVGLGLSAVKDTVRQHNGRATAKVADGIFILTIAL